MHLDAKIWGPHYWFFIHSLALTYPDNPNDVIKRKYYDFFMNLPLFLPDMSFAKDFSAMLDNYPVSPYLANKDSLFRWTVFIHNKINALLGNPSITVEEAMDAYYAKYQPEPTYLYKDLKIRRYYLHVGFILAVLALAFYLA